MVRDNRKQLTVRTGRLVFKVLKAVFGVKSTVRQLSAGKKYIFSDLNEHF